VAYAAELDDLRQEVRLNVATTIVFWPKVDGSGNVTASSNAGDNTVEIRKPSGEVEQASTNISPTAVASVGSRFDISVPAIATLGEDYHAVLTWRESGSSFARLEVIYFDVVREPWGPSSVSLNSMQSLVPDIGDRLNRQASRLSQTAEQRASVVGHQARIELGNWLRQAVTEDTQRMSSAVSDEVLRSTTLDAYLRPRLIKDKTRLHNIEVKLAVALAYGADMRADSEDGDAVAGLYEKWLEAAKTSFSAMGPLKYDLDDTLAVDTTIRDVGRFIPVSRVQS
jgi:hypothetical protein